MVELLGGKYEVLELAGEGGMAKVYRGQTHGAAGFTRPVAIKRVLAPLSQNPEFLKMFVEEARVVSELDHPNIAQIHDFDRDRSGEYYLVLEWVEGLTLSEWRQGYRAHGNHTPWSLTAAIGIEVLEALHAAHARLDAEGRPAPVFHRDVTPQNVMLSNCGVVKLTDFGLAREKLFKGEDPLTVLGTIRESDTPDLSEFRDDLPQRLLEIIKKALRRNPIERYATSREMARDLAMLLRTTDEVTDSHVIAQSVRWATAQFERAQLSEPPTKPFAARDALAEADSAEETIPDTSIPLTRRK